MVIDLNSFGDGTQRQVTAEITPGELDFEEEDLELAGPVKIEGRMINAGGKFALEGKITGRGSIRCSRCLRPVDTELDLDFRAVFVRSDEAAGVAEIEVEGDALDESVLEADTLELADVVREQVMLSLSGQNLCSDSCRGLCPMCGEDRNLIDCTCAENDIDPRWNALKSLK